MECIIFSGIQASGKSTYYKKHFADTHLRINLDMLNRRSREKIIFEAAVLAKAKIVIDNTNTTFDIRAKFIPLLKKYNYKIIGYQFNSYLQDCLERNKHRTGDAKIPEEGIKRFSERLQLLSYSEGFDELYYIGLKPLPGINLYGYIKRRI